MPDLAFDIETCPLPDELLEKQIPPYEEGEYSGPPSNYKKEEAKQKHYEDWLDGREAREAAYYDKARTRACLYSHTGRVLAVGYCDGKTTETVYADNLEDERALLLDFAQRCRRALTSRRGMDSRDYSIVGYNIDSFDVRMLWQRANMNGIHLNAEIGRTFVRGRYVGPQFIDLWRYHQGPEYNPNIPCFKLDFFASLYGLEGKATDEGVSGANFWKVAAEDRARADRYLKRDAELVWELGCKMGATFMDRDPSSSRKPVAVPYSTPDMPAPTGVGGQP